MSKRVPASMRTRQSLSDVIEGRLIIEETLEAEARDAVGRDGAEPGSGYRNRYYVGCMTRTRRFLGPLVRVGCDAIRIANCGPPSNVSLPLKPHVVRPAAAPNSVRTIVPSGIISGPAVIMVMVRSADHR